MAEPVIQNALQLRHFADRVASLRGVRLNVFAGESDGDPLFSIDHLGDHANAFATPIMELDTRYQQPRRVVPDVWISAEGGAWSLERYDAVYWTEAAVEKFVLPYYASKSLWMAAQVLVVLSRNWYGFLPGVDPAPELTAGPVEEEIPIPFALAHLPTSDYVTLEDHVPGADLHLLYRQPDGSVLAKSLADLLRAEHEAGGQNG